MMNDDPMYEECPGELSRLEAQVNAICAEWFRSGILLLVATVALAYVPARWLARAFPHGSAARRDYQFDATTGSAKTYDGLCARWCVFILGGCAATSPASGWAAPLFAVPSCYLILTFLARLERD